MCNRIRRPRRARVAGIVNSRSRIRGFPLPCRVLGWDCQHLSPGGQVGREHDQRAPDPVMVEPLQWQVPQAGVLRDPDPVLTSGAAAAA